MGFHIAYRRAKVRKATKTDFEKDMWKLLANPVFGKTMENVEKRVDCNFVTSYNEAVELHSKSNYSGCLFIRPDLTRFVSKK